MGVLYHSKYRYYTLKGKYKNEFGLWKDYERTTPEFQFKRKSDAADADKKLRKELSMRANLKSHGSMTFEDVSKLYIEEQKGHKKSTTLYTDEKIFKKASSINEMQITLITAKSIQEIINDMDKAGNKMNYIDKVYITIGKVFKFALKKHIISENPMERVYKIKRADEVIDDSLKYWTPREFEIFISNVEDYEDYAFFNFLYHTGCRKGEALALNWNDLDFDKKTFHIYKTCSQSVKGVPFLITPPKTPNSYRTKRMSDKLTNIMISWYTVRSKMYGFKKDCFVFGSLDKPMSTSSLNRHFRKYTSFGNGWVSQNQLQHTIKNANEKFNIGDSVVVKDGIIKNNALGYRTIKNYKKELIIDYLSDNQNDPCPYHVTMPLTNISIHGLRHSHATLLINNISNGANIKAIADRLGDTVTELLKTYSHLFQETENELIDIIEKNT